MANIITTRKLSLADHDPSKSLTTPRDNIPGLPDFGWRVKLDYECQEKCKPFTTPRLRQLPALIGLGLRYSSYMLKCRRQGRRPHMDHTNPVYHKPIYGCPMGGIGCGTIGRGYRGEFCRFQMVPGIYEHKVIPADQFIVCIRKKGQTVYQKVLTGNKPKCQLKSWQWGFPLDKATYHALYPRAWTVYDIPEHRIKLTCRQISPVIPNDYKDSSFPMVVFIWTVENYGSEPLDVSVTFTFKNGRGNKEDSVGNCWNETFSVAEEGSHEVSGVSIHQTFQDMPCTYSLAATRREGVNVSHKVHFDPCGSGDDLWNDLEEDGKLDSKADKTQRTRKGQETAAAVCIQCNISPKESKTLEFSLTWDMPIIHFRSKGFKYRRRYARWFGDKGDSGPKLCSYALHNYPDWEHKIEEWQNPVLQCSAIPAWYKSALFNELYYVSDGGTVWVDPVDDSYFMGKEESLPTSIIKEYGMFAYLEGQEYRMYNTYDVHHYASFALIMLWPQLQLSLQCEMAKIIRSADNSQRKYCMHGTVGNRKTINMVPHDIGDPEDEPWSRVNAYNIHPTDDWKDLNLKFILQVYRDYHLTKNEEYLKYMYPVTKILIEAAHKWDTDGDGIIDNGGFADQTFDAWIMHGASAYCGGMWLCALKMFCEMAQKMGQENDRIKFAEILNRGMQSFEKKLWNGEYYNYDSSTCGHHDSIMADQLAGYWYMKCSGINESEIFPSDHVKSALQKIFQVNVKGFGNGNMGAINGARPDGKKDISSCQSEEFWVGVTYGLASQMIHADMLAEAFQTAWGNYSVCWEWLGLQFQIPEAFRTSKHYRSLGYMRPLCIWSMQLALQQHHPEFFQSNKS
ncbi:hypothetical protein CHS0354_034127 [Potamilus streckersoni]|uniref:Non-lysosomal glucosylceramidase n=1 Tax=Potamilus streckersoni TaxID=2493646 RepID=A0AAE0TD65_9BIVA|nr:hypothetical protein CHS0354_034127 [Potamilus streckersoni]